MPVSFLSHDVDFSLPNKKQVSAWISHVVKICGFKPDQILFIYCSDEYILETNLRFLQHNYYTDVITFDYSKSSVISGDILISIQTVESNSIEYKVPFINELLRVMIHGVLHLVGFNDSTPHEKQIMSRQEDAMLDLFATNFK